jgi:uncharacterized protein YecT (DUF1311 family)
MSAMRSFRQAWVGLMMLACGLMQAEDCSLRPLNASTTLSLAEQQTRMDCAKTHADFLYKRDCGSKDYCDSQDSEMISAYAAAANMFDAGWPIKTTAQAWIHGFLEERGHLYERAVPTYRHCLELAKVQDRATGEKCGTRLSVLSESVNLYQVGGGRVVGSQRNPDKYAPGTLVPVKIITIGGGKTASVAENTTKDAPQEYETLPVVVMVTTPTETEVKALGAAMSDKERETVRQKIKIDGAVANAAGTATDPI